MCSHCARQCSSHHILLPCSATKEDTRWHTPCMQLHPCMPSPNPLFLCLTCQTTKLSRSMSRTSSLPHVSLLSLCDANSSALCTLTSSQLPLSAACALAASKSPSNSRPAGGLNSADSALPPPPPGVPPWPAAPAAAAAAAAPASSLPSAPPAACAEGGWKSWKTSMCVGPRSGGGGAPYLLCVKEEGGRREQEKE